jgi:hypothetical protein
MKYFTIDTENNITVHANRQAARDTGAGVFSNEVQFADLIGTDNKRLLDIWNSLPGVKPVAKFANRKAATERIWSAIQRLGETPAAKPEAEVPATELTPEVIEAAVPVEFQPQLEAAPAPASEPDQPIPSAEKGTETPVEPAATELPVSPAPTAEPVANAGAQGADVATTTPAATKKAPNAPKPGAPREGSKTSQVIAMLKREGGTTLEEIMAEMGWLKHTTRAMLSAGGSLTKKHGLVVTSEKVGDKRIYRINQ